MKEAAIWILSIYSLLQAIIIYYFFVYKNKLVDREYDKKIEEIYGKQADKEYNERIEKIYGGRQPHVGGKKW